MDIIFLTQLLKWCCIINFGCLLYIVLVLMLFPKFVYQVHSRYFRISREAFDLVIYSFIGVYKIFFVVFNLVPFVALKIIS